MDYDHDIQINWYKSLTSDIKTGDLALITTHADVRYELFNKIITITHKKIIVSKDSHNHKTILPYFVFKTCKNLLLNSGTYMGRAIDIFNMLKILTVVMKLYCM